MVRVSEAGTGQDGAGFEAQAIVVRISEAGTDLAAVLFQAIKMRLGLLRYHFLFIMHSPCDELMLL